MASELKVDTISEKTTASGVTVDGVLVKDGAIASSYISGLTSGLSAAQQWRLTANITTNGTNDITANLEVPDTSIQGNLASIVSESSGIFSFSQTGYYMVIVNAMIGGGKQSHIKTLSTNDATNYTELAQAGVFSDTEGIRGSSSFVILDITDTTNMKVKFQTYMQYSGAAIYGSTTLNYSYFTFLKLGDT